MFWTCLDLLVVMSGHVLVTLKIEQVNWLSSELIELFVRLVVCVCGDATEIKKRCRLFNIFIILTWS